MTEDKRAVETWENEGGKVAALKSLSATLRAVSLLPKYKSNERRNKQQLVEQRGIYSGFNMWGVV